MYRHTPHQQIIYHDLELLKASYKVEPPTLSPNQKTNRLPKEEPKKTETSEGEGTGSTDEITCNAFAKTKHLFRKREPSSVMADDLTDADIFTIEPAPRSHPHPLPAVQKFQFDSFGCQERIPAPSAAFPPLGVSKQGNIDLRGWNSSSFQIDFGKSVNRQLELPEHGKGCDAEEAEDNLSGTLENSSIKQFCFRIQEKQNGCLTTTTPVKKWSELKKSKAQLISNKIMTQPAADDAEDHRCILRKEMEECMNVLVKTDRKHLTPKVVKDTKDLLEEVRDRLTGVRKKLNFDEQSGHPSKQEQSSTMRMFGTPISNKRTKRTQKGQQCQHISFTKSSCGKFKVYQGTTSIKPQSKVNCKPQKKGMKKEGRFRF